MPVQTETELKPCPFCGKSGRLVKKEGYGPAGGKFSRGYVACNRCGINTPSKSPWQKSVELWNRRPAQPASVLLAEAVKVKPLEWRPPQDCDGKEQLAFEEWASGHRLDMHEHPLHYLFMDPKTAAARQAWKAALAYVRKLFSEAALAAPAQPVEAQTQEKVVGALECLLDACIREFGYRPDAPPEEPVSTDPECEITWGDLHRARAALTCAKDLNGGDDRCPTCNGTGKEGRHSICRDCDEGSDYD